MANLITLSSQVGHAPTNQTALNNVGYQPMLDYTTYQDKMPNGSNETFDGYKFETDWNGSTNYMRSNQGNLFANDANDGLRLYASSSMGKDRKLWVQYWERFNSNLYLPNVIGFTGMWKHNNRQYHPRLEMVCFHYCDSTGDRAGDYRPTESLRSYNSSNHYWNYGEGGQHDSGSEWWIGYQLTSSRRQTVYNSQLYLHGISLQILYRTAAGSQTPDGRFWNFKPIIAKDSGGATLSDADTCKSGKRLVIPARGNTYPRSGNLKLT